MYGFSYFKTNSEALYMLTSDDGYNWKPFNNGSAVLTGTVGEKTLRDPFVFKDQQGVYHLISTNGWQSSSIVHTTSTDLLNWTDQKFLPVMGDIKGVSNTWAPECIYDSKADTYMIYWSSTVRKSIFSKRRNHRIWYTTTKDFNRFTESKVLFDPGYNVIDASIIKYKSQYLMAFKDERGQHLFPKYKGIRMCTSESPQGPFKNITDIISPKPVEGPSLFIIEDKLVMFYDYFTKGRYGASSSLDGNHWQNVDDSFNLPNDLRHGAVFKL